MIFVWILLMSIHLRNTSRKFLYIEKTFLIDFHQKKKKTILIFLTIFYIFFHKSGVKVFIYLYDLLINALKAFRPFLKIYT